MVTFPGCKINLGLHVVSKRPDGFHDIETCFYPVPWTDILEIVPAPEFAFTSSGIPIPGDSSSNLCVKAYEAIKKRFDIRPVKIHLHKIVPMGAGLGGGSSDGARTLQMLNTMFDLNIPSHELAAMALELGSDCPFFLHERAMLGTGRGEILTPLPVSLNGKTLVLVKPPVHVPTAWAYSQVKPAKRKLTVQEILETKSVYEWKQLLVNDFEKSVEDDYADIRRIRAGLYKAGAIYAAMSGSGSAVFGIFADPVEVMPEFKKYLTWVGRLA